jgi:UPF0271 protein
MKKTLLSAKSHNVVIGAHPSYPDLAGFGRRSMNLPAVEIIAIVQYQIAALAGMAENIDMPITYVKPHGALYNDMMTNGHIRSAVMEAIAGSHLPLAFMLQATPDAEGAVHSREKMLAQVSQLKNDGSVTTISGHRLELQADSLCVHGDNIDGINAIQEIRQLINS